MSNIYYVGYKNLSSSLEKFILKKCLKSNISKIEIKLFFYWKSIVGLEISEFAKPEKLVFKENSNSCTLYVAVNNSGMALSLQYMIPIIIEKIAVFFGYKSVSQIKIRQKHF